LYLVLFFKNFLIIAILENLLYYRTIILAENSMYELMSLPMQQFHLHCAQDCQRLWSGIAFNDEGGSNPPRSQLAGQYFAFCIITAL
jgi:hypothetical protein